MFDFLKRSGRTARLDHRDAHPDRAQSVLTAALTQGILSDVPGLFTTGADEP
jgi:hypothetical protein